MTERTSVKQRFDAKWIPEPNTGCWLWTASTRRGGYGTFRVGEKMVRAHRYAYERWVGPIPDGLELDHLCRNPTCVNPDHLEPVTHRENTLRGETIAAANAAKTHCPQGHPYDERNTYVYPNGRRNCRTCDRDRDRPRRGAPKVAA